MSENIYCEGCSHYSKDNNLPCSGILNTDGSCPCCVCIVKMTKTFCYCEAYMIWSSEKISEHSL